MGMYKALYGLYLKMVVEMETSCWSGSVITPTTGKNINLCRMPRARLQWKSSLVLGLVHLGLHAEWS